MVDYEQFEGQQIRGVRIQHWETTNKMKKPSQEANKMKKSSPVQLKKSPVQSSPVHPVQF
jgi:hypothetical protein